LLAFYLVTTSLLTARRHDQHFHWMDVAAALIGLTAAILGFTFGTYAVRSPTGMLDEQVGAPAFVFGGVALLAVLGDLRMMLGRIHGARRIARHLWRMCFAYGSPPRRSFWVRQRGIPRTATHLSFARRADVAGLCADALLAGARAVHEPVSPS
jgi:hypothetical protein